MSKRGVRLRDIAERAGVSISTVSLVLNEKAMAGNVRISERTIQHVRQIAREMDYFPNLSARAMSGGQTTIVGLILPEIRYSSAQLPMIQGISETLQKKAYSLATGLLTLGRLELELEEVRVMSRKGFDCLIIECSREFMNRAEKYRELFWNPERVILLNRLPVAGLPSVTIDHFKGAYLATKHLLDLGHRAVAFVGVHCSLKVLDEQQDLIGSYGRFRGYLAAMRERDLPPVAVDEPEALFDLKPSVTGVYCGRSWGAADLLGACQDRGVPVPEALSIVGQDDAREKILVRPRITCVDVRPAEIGRLAGKMALDVIADQSVDSQILEPRLILRESTDGVLS